MKKLKPLFFLIGVGAYLAAGIIFFATRKGNPFSTRPKWLLANPKYDGIVRIVEFSPDGQKLAFEVRNETGELSVQDIYLYNLDQKKVRKLNIENTEIFTGWAPDSRRLTFVRRKPHNPHLYDGYVYDTEQDAIVEKFNLPFERRGWSPNDEWQLFRHPITGVVYVKEIGKPQWLQLPEEARNILYWSRDGNSLLFLQGQEKDRKLLQYVIKDGTLQTVAYLNDYFFRITSLYLVPYADVGFLVTSRALDESDMSVIRKLDLRTGEVIYSFDGNLPEGNGIFKLFIPPQINRLYFYIGQYETRGELQGEPSRVVSLDMDTGKMEMILGKEYRPLAYCGKTDMFAVRNDPKTLSLFDVKTRTFERVYPVN
jgi:hypothetical protein